MLAHVAAFLSAQSPEVTPRPWYTVIGLDLAGPIAILTLFALLAKFKVIRWFGKRMVAVFAEPVSDLIRQPADDLRAEIMPVIEEIRATLTKEATALELHRQYVYQQLGPNGDTKPIHQRLIDLEKANGIES